ncbi:MAG TPA: hypothetical protein VHC67_00500 [Gaiellaceae bacterium]|jgi:hypothetical protein|nr:hypothetical protein [Gaiellaceae bacterium]
MTTPFIILNLVLALIALGAVLGLVVVAHRLPDSAPHSDESWGTEGARIPSEPLPLRQVSEHADERDAARAA